MNLFLLILIIAICVVNPMGGLGILSGLGIIALLEYPRRDESPFYQKFRQWSWYNVRV